ncbi:MAG: YeeE/YedE family protein [Myxococcales bacterium]|nr:YeeE/YedE family protein [Myxococcales bacterium]
MQFLGSMLIGALFGGGLLLGGMARPAKVLGFLDVFGHWDPSLAFVMLGAIGVYAPLYRFITARTLPVYAQRFMVVAGRQVDRRLLLGSLLFGVGWGLSGFCPGPGTVAFGSGQLTGSVFFASMVAGMLLFQLFDRVATPAASSGGSEADGSGERTTPAAALPKA